MARSKSSRRWLGRHFSDVYVKKAQELGYRSRAAFKLLEIQEKDRILRPGLRVVDLGATPGGWSQVAARLVKPSGRLIALDLLAMDPLPGVEFIHGDFTDEAVLGRIMDALGGQSMDLVMSDMAPNISGVRAVDQPRTMYLAELALDFAGRVLSPGGDMLIKVFQGEGYESYVASLRQVFAKVLVRKPKASRPESREVYLLARNRNV